MGTANELRHDVYCRVADIHRCMSEAERRSEQHGTHSSRCRSYRSQMAGSIETHWESLSSSRTAVLQGLRISRHGCLGM